MLQKIRSIFHSEKSTPSYEWGLELDMHNHVLPGIDDGAKQVSDSLLLIQGLQDLGFITIIPSPHIASGLYANSAASIHESWQSILSQRSVTHFVAEYMLDDAFFQELDKGLLCYPNQSKHRYVLVEFPYIALPFMWHEMVFEIRKRGYQPILAHPERYAFVDSEDEMEKFMNVGFQCQLNLLSLSGYYGKDAKVKADQYMKQGYYQFAGTDVHHMNHLNALTSMKKDEKISTKIAAYSFQNHLLI